MFNMYILSWRAKGILGRHTALTINLVEWEYEVYYLVFSFNLGCEKCFIPIFSFFQHTGNIYVCVCVCVHVYVCMYVSVCVICLSHYFSARFADR